MTKYNDMLAPGIGWRDAYVFVAEQARILLDRDRPEKGYSTEELVEKLYPEQLARGDGIAARQRIFKALAALAVTALADCARRGETFKRFGVERKRWRWYATMPEFNDERKQGKVCPHCGGML